MEATMAASTGIRPVGGRTSGAGPGGKNTYGLSGRKAALDHSGGLRKRKETGVSGLRKVFICSPYRPQGKTEGERKREILYNINLAQYASRYAVLNGYVPYAPHLYFPLILDDDDPQEREMGLTLGLTWLARCDELWVIEHRISEGMQKEIRQAQEWGIPVKHFCLPRTGEDRVLDQIFHPETHYHEMKLEEK